MALFNKHNQSLGHIFSIIARITPQSSEEPVLGKPSPETEGHDQHKDALLETKKNLLEQRIRESKYWSESVALGRILDALVKHSTTLDLSCLGLSALPDEIALLENLKKLIVAYNYITTLKGIERLPSLQILNASHNKISEFSDDEIKKLQLLERLVIEDNPFKKRIMIYGFVSCKYTDVAAKVFQCFTTHLYTLGTTDIPETRPGTTIPIYKIPLSNQTEKNTYKAALVNIVLDNFSLAHTSPPEEITPCLFCIASDNAPFDPKSLIRSPKYDSFTNSEMKRVFKLCYDSTLPNEVREVAKKTFLFCQVHIEKMNADCDGYPKSWDHYLSLIPAPWDDPVVKEALTARFSKKPDRATKMWRTAIREKYDQEVKPKPAENAVVGNMANIIPITYLPPAFKNLCQDLRLRPIFEVSWA